MVVTSPPTANSTGVEQDRTGCPFRCTVHAPHSPAPQPNLAPFSPSSSRNTHNKGVSPSISNERCSPLTIRLSAMPTLSLFSTPHAGFLLLYGRWLLDAGITSQLFRRLYLPKLRAHRFSFFRWSPIPRDSGSFHQSCLCHPKSHGLCSPRGPNQQTISEPFFS